MRRLHLTLKKQWFDMIASGKKVEEYREIKPHWQKRLDGRYYRDVVFKNGYAKDAPAMRFLVDSIEVRRGNPEWGAPDFDVYVISLGRRMPLEEPSC